MGSRRRRALSLVALLLLAAIPAAVVGPLVHTDDGCAVERHCTACRTALASVGAAPDAPPEAAAPLRVDPAAREADTAVQPFSVAAVPTRGPPALL